MGHPHVDPLFLEKFVRCGMAGPQGSTTFSTANSMPSDVLQHVVQIAAVILNEWRTCPRPSWMEPEALGG